MTISSKGPRILVVTPEVTCMRQDVGSGPRFISARAGGLGDMCATQVHELFAQGVDVHITLPNYRNVFKRQPHRQPSIDIRNHLDTFPADRIHLAQDRSFFYHPRLFESTNEENIRISLAFQREVINRIIPEVQPDLIHCYDWMTGLVPAMVRRIGIPCLFTMYRCVSPYLRLSTIEEQGIDAATFWQYCYYSRMPINYQETRNENPLDMLASGVFSASRINLMSHSYLDAVTDERNSIASPALQAALASQQREHNILVQPPIPGASFNPKIDCSLVRPFGPDTHLVAKPFNKLQLQEALKLRLDSTVPICFWPTRLEGSRDGCSLMADVLPTILDRYREKGMQVVFIADGDYQGHFMELARGMDAAERVAVCDFDCQLYRLAYGGADFVLMPLRSDPCALPCKIGHRYGALPIAYDACAIHDCVQHLVQDDDMGNGFLFQHFDANGFLWALDQAMKFYQQHDRPRSRQVKRIMTEAMANLDLTDMARHPADLYHGIHNGFRARGRAEPKPSESSHYAA